MAYNYDYEDVLNAKENSGNGLLSKIQIDGKVYELKDLIAREGIANLKGLVDALAADLGDLGKLDEVFEGKTLIEVIQQIQENAYDDTALIGLIAALESNKADKTQVASDIAAAVKAEADIARAAEKANADEIARVDAVLKAAIDDEDGKGLNSIKDLATWIEEHGEDAAEMSAAISKNAEDIAAMDEAYKAADEAIDGRLDIIEAALGEGEGSVADQIADAKDAAIEAAKGYTDGQIDLVEAELAKKEDKTNLKALAYKASASGTVVGQTISGVKANGQSAGSITVELEQSSHAMNSTGKYTPAGNVSGTVQTAGSIAVTAKHEDAAAVLTKGDYTPAGTVSADFSHAATAATLTKGDYTPAGEVSVALSGASFNAITGVGTQASFVEGAFTPASLNYAAADYSVAKEGLVGSVDENECLVFTAAGLEAISASKISSFNGGSKEPDEFVANSLPTMAAQTVGVQSASFTGTKAAEVLVTGVSYKKADIDTATFTGATVDIAASFAGTEGDIAVAGTCHDYAVKTAQFNPAAIEVAVGDIVVAEKNVTVQ